MMASASTVSRTIRLFADRTMSQAALSARLASEARSRRDELVGAGQAAPSWRTFVDGVEGASEDGARNIIVYRFSLIQQAAQLAIDTCIARSPQKSGDYKRAWFVSIGGVRWTGAISDIPPGTSDVLVTNDRPYARKIDTGGMKMSVPPGIVEAARQIVQRDYPSLTVSRIFVTIPGGYVLRGRSRRKDRAAGQSMTYPALLLSNRLT